MGDWAEDMERNVDASMDRQLDYLKEVGRLRDAVIEAAAAFDKAWAVDINGETMLAMSKLRSAVAALREAQKS